MERRQKLDSEGQCFESLVAPHLPRLFRLAYRLTGNKADAQDLVQDTCVVACENIKDIAAADVPMAWLLRVLQNRFIDTSRRSVRAPFVVMKDPEGHPSTASIEPDPEDSMQQEQYLRLVEQAFQQLEPDQRLLLGLRAEGHGLADIETITGIPREVLRARLHRARQSLARHLQFKGRATLAASRARSNA